MLTYTDSGRGDAVVLLHGIPGSRTTWNRVVPLSIMNGAGLDQRVKDVRSFSRFYTNRIGVLQEGILSSSFSLTEARVLYETRQPE